MRADEVLVVGHSTGAQAAVSLLARALKLEADPGRHGSQVSLLTLGGSIPMLAWWPQSQWFRDELERQPWWQRYSSVATVSEGVVHYWGLLDSEDEREAARVAAENIPGVRNVVELLEAA